MLQGIATFPGISSIVEATISFVHGISPSVATLTIKPQLNFIGKGGTLAFHFGGETIEFPDCKVDYNSLQRTARGEVWRLSIFDRRWEWKMGAISGHYNIKEADGSIKAGTEKTPHELAQLCFDAVDVVGNPWQLPNDSRPEVAWDYDLPMEALARLCDDLGCRIVPEFEDFTWICKVGEGKNLPGDGILENSLTIDPPEKPSAIAIVCGRTRYQVEFELEAIGLDTDGIIKLIDDLSYKPAAGWGAGGDVDWFQSVNNEFGELQQKLAQQTIYRWYRIKMPVNGVEIPGYPARVLDLEHFAIETEQVDTITENNIHGVPVERNRRAIVHGVWFPEHVGSHDNTEVSLTPQPKDTELLAAFRRSYVIDTQNKLVKFSKAIYRNTTPADNKLTIDVPMLRLLTACSVRDADTRGWERYIKERDIGPADVTKTRYVKHAEILLNHIPTYNAAFAVNQLDDNKAEVDVECKHYLDGIQQEYQQTLPQTITYIGLRKIELDGAIQQIVFHVGPSGATTTVARNTEILHRTLPYKERRRIEKQRERIEQGRYWQEMWWDAQILFDKNIEGIL